MHNLILIALFGSRGHRSLTFALLAFGICSPSAASAVGTWMKLANQAPDGINNMLLLPDGTVMAHDINNTANWYQLTPDSKGSYVNGTWGQLASMHYKRLYYSSQVLTNGQVFVAGAEYSGGPAFTGPGTTNAETYDPVANKWTLLPLTPAFPVVGKPSPFAFFDSVSEILPDGNVMVAPVSPGQSQGDPGLVYIWTNSADGYKSPDTAWSVGPSLVRGNSQDEASWVKLPDDSILTIDPFSQSSERYIPSLNQWINDSTVPVQMYSDNGELGAALLLPNGKAFFIGGTNHTAIYTPSGTTSPGTWAAGPNIPAERGAYDAPAAMMVNGKVLLCVETNATFTSYFYEFNYALNTLTAAPSPINSTPGASFDQPSFVCSMLDLPDGTVLMSAGTKQLYVYKPDGSPLAAGQPTITDCPTVNGSARTGFSAGPFQLSGTLLNGISEGAAYGDDEQMNSNYPIVRMTNLVTGNVYYNRTFNWNSTSVMTGAKIISTEFNLAGNLIDGDYSLVVVANGIASAPVTMRIEGFNSP